MPIELIGQPFSIAYNNILGPPGGPFGGGGYIERTVNLQNSTVQPGDLLALFWVFNTDGPAPFIGADTGPTRVETPGVWLSYTRQTGESVVTPASNGLFPPGANVPQSAFLIGTEYAQVSQWWLNGPSNTQGQLAPWCEWAILLGIIPQDADPQKPITLHFRIHMPESFFGGGKPTGWYGVTALNFRAPGTKFLYSYAGGVQNRWAVRKGWVADPWWDAVKDSGSPFGGPPPCSGSSWYNHYRGVTPLQPWHRYGSGPFDTVPTYPQSGFPPPEPGDMEAGNALLLGALICTKGWENYCNWTGVTNPGAGGSGTDGWTAAGTQVFPTGIIRSGFFGATLPGSTSITPFWREITEEGNYQLHGTVNGNQVFGYGYVFFGEFRLSTVGGCSLVRDGIHGNLRLFYISRDGWLMCRRYDHEDKRVKWTAQDELDWENDDRPEEEKGPKPKAGQPKPDVVIDDTNPGLFGCETPTGFVEVGGQLLVLYLNQFVQLARSADHGESWWIEEVLDNKGQTLYYTATTAAWMPDRLVIFGMHGQGQFGDAWFTRPFLEIGPPVPVDEDGEILTDDDGNEVQDGLQHAFRAENEEAFINIPDVLPTDGALALARDDQMVAFTYKDPEQFWRLMMVGNFGQEEETEFGWNYNAPPVDITKTIEDTYSFAAMCMYRDRLYFFGARFQRWFIRAARYEDTSQLGEFADELEMILPLGVTPPPGEEPDPEFPPWKPNGIGCAHMRVDGRIELALQDTKFEWHIVVATGIDLEGHTEWFEIRDIVPPPEEEDTPP